MKKYKKLIEQNYYKDKDGIEHHRFDRIWVWLDAYKLGLTYPFKESNRNKMTNKIYWLLWKRDYRGERTKFYNSIETGEW